MKNRKTVIAILVLAAFLLVAAACWFAFGPKAVIGNKTITVEISHLDGTTNTYTIETDEEYLRQALEQESLIEGSDSQYGIYILTMDGETVNEAQQQWWSYTKSGEQVNYGVDSCPITDGDHYEFAISIGW